MTGEDDVATLRVEPRPHAQARLVGLAAKKLRVNRPHESVHAIETFGSRARSQPFEITVRTCDVPVRAGCDVDYNVSALRHGYRLLGERKKTPCHSEPGHIHQALAVRTKSNARH